MVVVMDDLTIIKGDNLVELKKMDDETFDLIYIDPPFNTGKKQRCTKRRMICDDNGDRVGFGGKLYKTEKKSTLAFDDSFNDYLGFLKERFIEAKRIMKSNGSFFVHMDYREVHYAKVLLDEIFGRDSFMNEIIWSFDFGARSRKKWSTKHNTILWYAKNPDNYTFNYNAIDRIPYMAPSLVGEEKAKIGKTPTTVWWCTIVPTNGKERNGYPTQKPLKILERIVKVHSNRGDKLLDFFSGSGSFGEAALKHDRYVVLIDKEKDAVDICKKRLSKYL